MNDRSGDESLRRSPVRRFRGGERARRDGRGAQTKELRPHPPVSASSSGQTTVNSSSSAGTYWTAAPSAAGQKVWTTKFRFCVRATRPGAGGALHVRSPRRGDSFLCELHARHSFSTPPSASSPASSSATSRASSFRRGGAATSRLNDLHAGERRNSQAETTAGMIASEDARRARYNRGPD